MKNKILRSAFGLLVLATTSTWANAATPTPGSATTDATGRWSGAIEIPGTKLAITVSLAAPPQAGAWSGSIDIPAQGLAGFALSNVTVEGGRIRFEMAGVPGVPSFDGVLASDGQSIGGTFRQGPQAFPFRLTRSAEEQQPTHTGEPRASGIPGQGPAGNWLGALAVGPTTLRLALQVVVTADGAFAATLNSLDQGAEVPVAGIELDGQTVRIELPAAGASYRGTLSSDGSTIEGNWNQGGRSLPLVFERQAERVTLRRPQEPVPPFPYTTRDVTFRNQDAGLDLAGTYVVPAGDGPFPAVVLVSGSGPQDRDELIAGHRPFLVLADHLARQGIASLRFDDRGVGDSEGDHMGSTVADFASDVEAGVAFLIAQLEVDRSGIGIVGHSEGGVSGPMAAAASKDVDFLVLLAPPGVPLDRLMAQQTRDVLRQRGVAESLAEGAVDQLRGDLALVKDTSLDQQQLVERLRERSLAAIAALDEGARAQLGLEPAMVEQSVALAATAWFRSLMRVDPAVVLRASSVPVLALFGEKDVQVAAGENAEALRLALAADSGRDVEVQILPGLNHLFQRAGTGGVEEYGTIEETIAPEVLDLVATWINERFARAAKTSGG